MAKEKTVQTEQDETVAVPSRDKLTGQIKTVISDLEELVKVTKDQAGEEIKTYREKAEKTLSKAKMQLEELEKSSKEKIVEVVKVTDKYAHEKPWQLIGASAAVGLILGLLINRK